MIALLTLLAATSGELHNQLIEAENRVVEVRAAYYAAQLDEIQTSIDEFEAELPQIRQDPARYAYLRQRLPLLFDQERALLTLIIAEDPKLAPQAKALRDRILVLLTALNAELRESKKGLGGDT